MTILNWWLDLDTTSLWLSLAPADKCAAALLCAFVILALYKAVQS